MNIFENLFKQLWDLHAPLKRRLIKSTQHKHWIDGDLLKLYRQRNTLYKRFRQAGTSAAWMAYRQARNCCTAATRVAKRAFFFSARHKPHLFWNKIKECTGLGKLRQSSLFWPCSTPIISKVSANIINRSHLERISSLQQQQSHTSLSLSAAPAVLSETTRTAPSAFEFTNISPTEIRRLICELPSQGSTGCDSISASMLKFIPEEISSVLAKIFNMPIALGSFPIQWKAATVTAVYKKGNRSDINNYRSISILPLVAKIFERAVDRQFRIFLESHKLLSQHQHGFRKLHSCQFVLIFLTDTLFTNRSDKKHSIIASLDYSKAFDTLDHKILLNKLAALNMSE